MGSTRKRYTRFRYTPFGYLSRTGRVFIGLIGLDGILPPSTACATLESVVSKPDSYLSTHEVAAILGVSRQTLYNWLRECRIPEPKRNPLTKYRLWTVQDVDRIRQIVLARRP
jgi:excisionase family DNA binding protein